MHLDQIVEGLSAEVSPFGLVDINGDASFTCAGGPKPSIFYVVSGHGFASSDGGWEKPLVPHTVIVAPAGVSLHVACGRRRERKSGSSTYGPFHERSLHDTTLLEARAVAVACAYFSASHVQTRGLFDYLHEPMLLNFCKDDDFRREFRLLIREATVASPGSRALSEAAFKQCLIGILRRLSESDGEFAGTWLAAVTNRAISSAIAAILDHPERPHTLDGLAAMAGMSRTPFAAQFKEITGTTPIGFVRDVRMRRAIRLLTSTDLPIKVISARVGIGSRSYFSKAFKVFTGTDPVTFRNQQSSFESGLPVPVK